MQTSFIYSEELTKNILREDHVLRPMRLRLVYELLQSYNVFSNGSANILEPRIATPYELMTFHSRDYIEAVGAFSNGDDLERQHRYGFSDWGDNPISTGMYEAAALAVGASLTGVDAILDGSVELAFNAGGGYHHAASDYASGFCIFNDAVIAIQAFLQKGVERIAYIDIDAHHGDGVQNAFYETDKVMTISIHQSGDTLFPGTGGPEEIGEEKGAGYSINLPLPPATNDETYFDAFNQLVPDLIKKYDPQVLVAQLGIDTHFNDPLSQLSLTSQGHNHIVKQIIELTPGKLLALGGGGYDLSAVARSWALDYATMAGLTLPNDIPEKYSLEYGINRLEDDPIPNSNMDSIENIVQNNIRLIKENVSKHI